MTPEQALALMGGMTALITATAALLFQVRGLRKDIDGRMKDLVQVSAAAARARGELEGRDFMQRLITGQPPAPEA